MGNGNETSGDGYRYRGRGLIQLTGHNNYQMVTNDHNNRYPNDEQSFLDNPELLVDDLRYAVESVFSYWVNRRYRYRNRNLSLHAQGRITDVREVTFAVNGGYNGLANRIIRFNAVAPLLNLDTEE